MNIKIVAKQNQLSSDQKAVIVAGYLKRLNRDEANFKRRLNSLFTAQKNEVLRKLPQIFLPKGLGLKAAYFKNHQKAVNDVLFDESEQVSVFIRFERPILTENLRQAAEEIYGITGEAFSSFDLQTKRVAAYLEKQSKKFAKRVNDTTIKDLRRELRLGLEDGETLLSDFQARVEKVYDKATSYRAERIARTELGSAENFGEFEAYQQSEVTESKEWVTVIDDRTRGNDPNDEFNHIELDGEVVPKNERFDVGGEFLQFPRDPAGSAGNVVNCRCRTLPVFRK